jgi:hypothetical protein
MYANWHEVLLICACWSLPKIIISVRKDFLQHMERLLLPLNLRTSRGNAWTNSRRQEKTQVSFYSSLVGPVKKYRGKKGNASTNLFVLFECRICASLWKKIPDNEFRSAHCLYFRDYRYCVCSCARMGRNSRWIGRLFRFDSVNSFTCPSYTRAAVWHLMNCSTFLSRILLFDRKALYLITSSSYVYKPQS